MFLSFLICSQFFWSSYIWGHILNFRKTFTHFLVGLCSLAGGVFKITGTIRFSVLYKVPFWNVWGHGGTSPLPFKVARIDNIVFSQNLSWVTWPCFCLVIWPMWSSSWWDSLNFEVSRAIFLFFKIPKISFVALDAKISADRPKFLDKKQSLR